MTWATHRRVLIAVLVLVNVLDGGGAWQAVALVAAIYIGAALAELERQAS